MKKNITDYTEELKKILTLDDNSFNKIRLIF